MTMRLRTQHFFWRKGALCALALAATAVLAGCPTTVRAPETARPEKAEKWFQRALGEYRQVAIEPASDSVRQALELVPTDPEVRLLGARIALARLDYDEVLRLLSGMKGSQAASLRGRAHWYRGDVEHAAEELDQLLTDPDVDDAWAKSISALAHGGAGRKPFDTSVAGGAVVAVEMTRIAQGATPLYVVPVEINGEPVLALIATGTSEVMLDSASSAKPSWISLRFGRRVEVRDVPALAQDLSGLSQQLGGPIKALLGANLLRHLNVTLDFRGRQFVARTYSPPPPPLASRLDVAYLRGGGMVVNGVLGEREQASPFIVDTSMGFALALDDAAWKKIGLEVATLPRVAMPGGELRQSPIPVLKLGTVAEPSLDAVSGPSFERLERELEVDLDGAIGSRLLARYRLTLSDAGRILWLERPESVATLPGTTLPPLPPDAAPAAPATRPTAPSPVLEERR
ncbi:MAG: hypothetical protein FJ096_00565 [Deltaproteobacteria bacterium]|nr:hypothetical protein [Deltaproteobacteria bacterium]